MRTVRLDAPGQIRVDTLPDPSLPGPDGAIVEVTAAAICGSDLHFYEGDYPLAAPVALGHEAVGTVVETGPDVRTVKVGDSVLVSSVAGCGKCVGCATRDPITCLSGPLIFGSGALGGGQSELLAVPAADFQLLRIPDGIDDEAALLLTDNLGTGWAGAQRADIPPGGTVAVLGLGAVGQCAVRSALLQGAGQVLAYDPVAGRRELAARSGAVSVDGPLLDAVMAATGGRGADAVIDAVAIDATIDDAFASVRAGGTVSLIGVHDMNPYPLGALMGVYRSITLRMTTAPVHRTWTDLVPLVQHGRFDTSDLFTHTFDLDDAAAAYAAVGARGSDCIKARFLL